MQKNKMIIIALIILVVIGIGILSLGYYKKSNEKVQNPIATIEIKDMGVIKLELYPNQAPNTVANFIALANNGFYDDLTFHRIISNFMVQGGDINGDGTGGPTLADLKEDGLNESYSIYGEFAANGYEKNNLRHEKGVISMARSDYSNLGLYEEGYNSAGSQFFIVTESNNQLNGQYTGFGKIIEGLDILDKLAAIEVMAKDEESEASTPVNPPIITSIRVETNGVNFGEPETLQPFDYQTWLMQKYGIDPSALGQ